MDFRKIFITAVVGAAALGCWAGPVDEARKLYRGGDYAAAAELMKPVVKRSPKDGNANFFYGASLYRLGDYDAAVAPLTVAEGRGVGEAAQLLAELALDRYDAEGASDHLDKWEAIAKKGKKSVPQEHEELTSRMIQMRNMLERVERIEIIDSLTVDSAAFFEAYRLSPQAGRILPPDAVSRLGAGSGDDELSTAYMPENRSELLWAAADSTGIYRLFGADILDDGTLDHSAPLDDSLGDGGDAKFPFLMPDGVTLYYASNGSGSLGGYDIFMTRRTDADGGKEYFKGQNVGMPYNSPYDDYLLAIDEVSGLGWWATDRNRIPGKVTVYVFAPSQMRVNADPSDPNLAALAMLSDISLTRKDGVDYAAMRASRLPAVNDSDPSDAARPRFEIDMGNGKVYFRLSDFTVDRARRAMLEALGTEATLRKHLAAEDAMRERFRRGDSSLRADILSSERETETLRRRLATQRNTAVRLETAR
ncbi:MAG: hypothetical protein NC418_06400 [Muribaculaceae bacterium]|nr:hypothetical protein [Muribaculaceae bacterium]